MGVVVMALLLITSCSFMADPGYYTHVIKGEAQILLARRPINEVLADSSTPEEVRNGLLEIRSIRSFATRKLGLKDNEGYTSYTDIGRPYVNWSLSAAPEFSTKPKMWRIPFFGRAEHLTFFTKTKAEAYASDLKAEGYDVFVRGVHVHSTNGWFEDPVLNTFLLLGQARMAGIIFHEKTHETVYTKADYAFSEGLAMFVQSEGERLWIKEKYGPEALILFEADAVRFNQLNEIIMAARHRLDLLYRSGFPEEVMRLQKSDIFSSLLDNYKELEKEWGGWDNYNEWMHREWNNARIAEYVKYNDNTPAFRKMFENCGKDFHLFISEARRIASLSQKERSEIMEKLATRE